MKYSIVQQPNQKGTKFTVDEETGEVSTNKVFDREGDDGKFVSVTVKATDQGEPSLEGVCSFTVEITDVNDNPPLFDRQVRFGCKRCRVNCKCIHYMADKFLFRVIYCCLSQWYRDIICL